MSESFKAKASGRLDLLLSEAAKITRSQAALVIKSGVLVDGKSITKAGHEVKEGAVVEYTIEKKAPSDYKPKEIPVPSIYEDDQILIVNKPRGMVVHPAPGHLDDTLANALAFRFQDKDEEEDEEFRMGIVHRIDKDTSGLLVVAKNEEAKKFLSDQLASHTVSREYLCLAYGYFKDKKFQVHAPIGRNSYDRKKMCVDPVHGKDAITHFEVIKQYRGTALLKCRLETGRTHQIRVHLAFINHPIVGDSVYSSRKCPGADQGQLLHAFKLSLVHPKTKKTMVFYACSDDYFKDMTKKLCLAQ